MFGYEYRCKLRKQQCRKISGTSWEQQEPSRHLEADNPVSDPKKDQAAAQNSKTDAEVILQGAELILNTTTDLLRKKAIKDSMREVYREKCYAYQLGMELKKQDALDLYKRLTDAGIKSVYIFRKSRKKYFVLKFQAKTEADLLNEMPAFKTELGEQADEGVHIINLMNYCNKRETINRTRDEDDGIEIKCLVCD